MRHATWLSVVLFIGLEAAAASRYPGGTWFDRSSLGYSFRFNYFCDLTSSHALNGAANPGAPLARSAMLVLSLGMIAFWRTLAELWSLGRMRSIAMVLGTTSGALASAVPFLPSVEVGWVHALMTTSAGVVGLGAGGLAIWGAFRRRELLVGTLGVGAFATGALVSVLYLASQVLHAETRELPLAQKLAAAVLLAWMIASALRDRDDSTAVAIQRSTSPWQVKEPSPSRGAAQKR